MDEGCDRPDGVTLVVRGVGRRCSLVSTVSLSAMSEHTRPSTKTRAAEASGAARDHGAGRLATPEEEAAADTNTPSAEAAANEKEMNERGAKQKGEGRA